tara:strand:- start:398 stop:913 length:516 start_codon:yes stop_codon:yes gene_type:complete
MKKGQIWIETVIYTLIGLAIIGILLSIIKPAIEKKQDQILIENSIEMLEGIKIFIEDVKYYGAGNTRTIDLKIKKGKIIFDSKNDIINFEIESRYEYSEPNQIVEKGGVNILTTPRTETFDMLLTLDYTGKLDLTWNEEDKIHTLQKTSVPHKISITNKGKINNSINIDFS